MPDISLQHALELHQQHDLDAAEAMYRSLRNSDPHDVGVMHAYAILLGQCQRYDDGIRLAKQMLAISSTSQHHNTLANLYKKNGAFKKSVEHYHAALAVEPDYAVAMNNLGALYLQLNQPEEAQAWLKMSLNKKPHYIDAMYNMGLFFVNTKQDRSAVEWLQQVVDKAPSHAQAWMKLSLLYVKLDNFNDALRCIQTKLALEPDDTDALLHEGVILLQLDQSEKAVQSFERCIVLQPDHMDAHHNVASTYMRLKQDARALPHYLFMAQKQPDPDVLFNVGVIYMHREQHQDAVLYFMQALKLDPGYLRSHINLASIYLKLQDIAKAKFHYQAAQAIDPDSEEYGFILSALDQETVPTQAPESYVSHLFDSYADAYDVHLNKYLRYQLPKLVYDALSLLGGDATHFDMVLDVGCGTGLTGEAIADLCGHMVGIDVSSKMLDIAKSKQVYQQLHHVSYQAFLPSKPCFDLVLAADVMPYIGDPEPFVQRCVATMNAGAYLVFSTEITLDTGYTLQSSIRYAHNNKAIRGVLESAGLEVLEQQPITARYQNNKPVASVLWVAMLPA